MLAVGAAVHQQLPTQPTSVMLGVVVGERFAGEKRDQRVVIDVPGIGSHRGAGAQLMPSLSFIPFSRRKFRFFVSSRPSTLL
jgi:hypothetical protein